MWGPVNDFAKGSPSPRVPYKIVVLDNADHITPSSQQVFKRLHSETEKRTKYIFIVRSLSKLTGHVLGKGPQYTTKLPVELDALGKAALCVLYLCTSAVRYYVVRSLVIPCLPPCSHVQCSVLTSFPFSHPFLVWLVCVLRVLQKEKIGFNREGIEFVFRNVPKVRWTE